jgi:DNA-binding IclR family transcriptional regulator
VRADAEYPVTDADEVDLEDSGGGSLVHSVQRALRIVRLFDSWHPEWSASELTRRSGLRRTTAFRLIKTLEAEEVLAVNPVTGKYFLGPAVYQFAYVWIAEASLARLAAPHLERLADATDESVGLTIWNGNGPLCVAHSPSPRPFKFLMYVGQVFTDLANAHSKVLLAFGPEERRTKALSRPLPALTAFTITDRDRYLDELRRVVVEGVAHDLQEQQRGVCAMAVPVRDFSGEVRASLSLVVSEVRYGPAEDRRYTQALKQVAAALSYELGYREPDPGENSVPL